MNKQFLILLLLTATLLSYGQANTEPPTYSPKGSLSLRTNVIPWLMLTPNIGVEYKTSDRIGLLVEGGWHTGA